MSPKTIGAAYKKALLESDFLLPDGIALQLFYWIASRLKKIKTTMPRLPNLNGTDFGLSFLQHIQERFGADELQIILYGTYPGILEKTKEVLTDKGFEILYAQDGYTNFDRDQVEELLATNRKKYTVLLVARTTPEYPIQELWARSNKESIKKHKLLVLNQGGTFDFWAGIQKRAPKLWRKYKLEWLWRWISDPKRNTKKIKDSLKIINYIFRYLLLKNR
jgi:N-acetylglucosaminyldiphosphoundecaprenol N-acetyl-beta-D-mannosaminyltransferase